MSPTNASGPVVLAGGFPTLGTGELDSLKRIFGGHHLICQVHEGDAASEGNFKALTKGITGLLHISTHGMYFPLDKDRRDGRLPPDFLPANTNPLYRSGLAFSGINQYWTTGIPLAPGQDGFLNGEELATLDLHQVQLVTLSACETGLGQVTDDEGNLGLQRGLKLAGAENLLVSLWQVDPSITTNLLSLFYNNWLGGMSLNEALRQAELTLRNDGKRKHALSPYRWAPFVLIE